MRVDCGFGAAFEPTVHGAGWRRVAAYHWCGQRSAYSLHAPHTCVHFSASLGYFSTAVMQISIASSFISACMSVYLTRVYWGAVVLYNYVGVLRVLMSTIQTAALWKTSSFRGMAHLRHPQERFHIFKLFRHPVSCSQ